MGDAAVLAGTGGTFIRSYSSGSTPSASMEEQGFSTSNLVRSFSGPDSGGGYRAPGSGGTLLRSYSGPDSGGGANGHQPSRVVPRSLQLMNRHPMEGGQPDDMLVPGAVETSVPVVESSLSTTPLIRITSRDLTTQHPTTGAIGGSQALSLEPIISPVISPVITPNLSPAASREVTPTTVLGRSTASAQVSLPGGAAGGATVVNISRGRNANIDGRFTSPGGEGDSGAGITNSSSGIQRSTSGPVPPPRLAPLLPRSNLEGRSITAAPLLSSSQDTSSTFQTLAPSLNLVDNLVISSPVVAYTTETVSDSTRVTYMDLEDVVGPDAGAGF